jgi:hypothetical protein
MDTEEIKEVFKQFHQGLLTDADFLSTLLTNCSVATLTEFCVTEWEKQDSQFQNLILN